MALGLTRGWRRRLLVGLVVLLVVALGAGIWLWRRPNGGGAASRTFTVTVGTGPVQQTVSATGTLAPESEADLDFAVQGTVTSVGVSAGEHVTAGQTLARVDPTSLQTAVTTARAQLDAAETAADDDGSASDAQQAANDAAVTAAQASLSQAEQDLDDATLTASMSGTVAAVNVAVGDQVSGTARGSGSGDASPSPSANASPASSSSDSAFVIISPKHFKIAADVAAADVKSVKKGMQAQVTPNGASQPVFGTVTDVGLVASTDSSGAATFPVTVTLTGPHTDLYAGTSATVAIVTKQLSNVLTVPTIAVHSSGSSTYVTTLVGGKQKRTPVKVGQTVGANTVITSGLKAGDQVVVTTFKLPSGGGRGGRNGDRGGVDLGGPGGIQPPGGFQGPGTDQKGAP